MSTVMRLAVDNCSVFANTDSAAAKSVAGIGLLNRAAQAANNAAFFVPGVFINERAGQGPQGRRGSTGRPTCSVPFTRLVSGDGSLNELEHAIMTTLSVLSSQIRQDDGLYSLNDLHQAAGGEKRHQPSDYFSNKQARELIEEIARTSGNSRNAIVQSSRGSGTYACKELVYAYAMWISPKFHLAVIRAFDQLQSQKSIPHQKAEPQLPDRVTREITERALSICTRGYEEVRAELTEEMLKRLKAGDSTTEILQDLRTREWPVPDQKIVRGCDLRGILIALEKACESADRIKKAGGMQ